MTDKEIAVLILSAASAGLYVYGSFVAHRIRTVVTDRYGGSRSWFPIPVATTVTFRRYRDMTADDDRLPLLHRSLRINQVLLVISIVATAVRLVRH